MSYVVDASVILQALLSERTKAKQWLATVLAKKEQGTSGAALISSCLLPLEVANGLRYTLGNTQKAQQVMTSFNRLPIKVVDLSPDLIVESVAEAKRLQTTVYDTSYHLLALQRGLVFATADEKYFRKAKGLGQIKLVV